MDAAAAPAPESDTKSAETPAAVAPPPVPEPVSGAAVVRVDVDSGATADNGVKETKSDAEVATKPRGASLVAAQKMSHRYRPPPGRFTLQYGFSQYHKVPIYVLLVGVLTFLVRVGEAERLCRKRLTALRHACGHSSPACA